MTYEEKDELIRAYVELHRLLGTFENEGKVYCKAKELYQEKCAKVAYEILRKLIYGDEQS